MTTAARLGAAAARLLDVTSPESSAMRAALAGQGVERAGLSDAGLGFALETTLTAMRRPALEATLEAVQRRSPGLVRPVGTVLVVLAASVCTASLHALALPLLLGNRVVAKLPRGGDPAAVALEAALRAVGDASRAERLVLLRAEHDDDALTRALAEADSVVVYGRDETVAALRARTRAGAAFVGHGHGLSVGYVGAALREDPAALAAAMAGFGLDVAAYDQHGCLSPQALLVEGSHADAEAVARQLVAEGLQPLHTSMPRGPVPLGAAGALLAYRGEGFACGPVLEGPSYAVCVPETATLRSSPGHRHLDVLAVPDVEAAARLLAPLRTALKAVALDPRDEPALLEALPPPLAPRRVRFGALQTPPFGCVWDGELPETGLVRHIG